MTNWSFRTQLEPLDLKLIRLHGSHLLVSCLVPGSNSWKESFIDLDTYMGNIDGGLHWGFQYFYESSRNVRLEGDSIKAECCDISGNWQDNEVEVLSRLFNNQGVVDVIIPIYHAPNDLVEGCKDITLRGTILSAKCFNGSDYHESSLDLNNFIGNIDGNLQWQSWDFRSSSGSVWLEGSSIVAECATVSIQVKTSHMDLRGMLKNNNGTLMCLSSFLPPPPYEDISSPISPVSHQRVDRQLHHNTRHTGTPFWR